MALKTKFIFDLEYALTSGGINLPDVETSIKKQVEVSDVYVRVVNVSPITAQKTAMTLEEPAASDAATEGGAVTLADGVLAEGSTVYVELYDSTKQNKLGVAGYKGFTPCNNDDAKNIIKQAYEFLKTLPDFAEAADIFEAGQAE